jgi:hypothetical protein
MFWLLRGSSTGEAGKDSAELLSGIMGSFAHSLPTTAGKRQKAI